MFGNFQVFAHASRHQPKVALTFDDGPTPEVTERVVKILDAHDVRATFFVVGEWVSEPDGRAIVELVLRSKGRHIIGNHSKHHFDPIECEPLPGELNDAERIISDVTGHPTLYARAPYFKYSHGVCTSLAEWVQQGQNRKIIGADRWGFEWEDNTGPEIIISNVLARQQGQPSRFLEGGAIICLHDGAEPRAEPRGSAIRVSRPNAMIQALPDIIKGLRSRKFELVGIDELEFSPRDAERNVCE